MTLYPIVDGNVIDQNRNKNWEATFRATGYLTVRQLIDRSIGFGTAGTDCFAEAYTTTAGRLSTVNQTTRDADTGQPDTNTTTATFSTNKYIAIAQDFVDAVSSGTTNDPSSVTSPANFFDSNDATYAEKTYSVTSPCDTYLGKTFSSTLVKWVYIHVANSNTGTGNNAIYLQTYDGATWTSIVTLASGTSSTVSYTGAYYLNATVQGVRIYMSSTGYDTGGEAVSHRFYELHYGSASTEESTIYHSIPSGRVGSTISSAILIPYLEDWEAGANITYKITNSTSDSGWLDCGTYPTMSTFNTFTAQPSTLAIKLTPKSGGTGSYPSIKGFALYAE